MNFFHRLVAPALLIACSGVLSVTNCRAEGLRIIRNLSYVSSADAARVCDVFIPEGKGDGFSLSRGLPLIIYAHGGGWEGGNKEEEEPVVKLLAEAGFVVVNVNYRLLGQGGEFPGDIEDMKDALAFTAEHARTWGANPDRIGAMGTSAGGHLALMLAYTPSSAIAAPHYPHSTAKVRAVVSWYGPTNLDALHGQLLDRYLANAPDGYRKASPTTYIHTAVPTLMVHGTSDPLVPYAQSKTLLAKLQAANVFCILHTVPNEGHGFTSGFQVAFEKTLEFFKRQL